MKLVFVRLFSLYFVFQVMSPPILAAEILQTQDIEPPTIIFEIDAADIPEGLNSFKARVTDNVGVSNVTLFYRAAGDIAFSSKPMTKLEKASDIYSTELFIDSVIMEKLEIYLKAEDVSGNSVFKGRKFTPLSYNVISNTPADVVNVGGEAKPEEEGMSTWTWVLIGLGVAALAGGGGGGGSNDTGKITVTTDVPN